jgi:uncharacterized protein (TIGR01777 family)
MKVVVTGGTGFIGKPLVTELRAQGHDVTVLSRSTGADLEVQGPWMDSIEGAGAVIHLAGVPIAGKRWDARYKQLVRDSRIEGTHRVVQAIERASVRPKLLVSASGVDFYPAVDAPNGFDDDEVTEADPPGDSFLARVCRDWEAEARTAEPLGVRVCCMRTGLVLGAGGGALAAMRGPVARLGDGRQWMSWIALADAVSAYAWALEEERARGSINLVTDSVRNVDFAAALGKPRWLGVPSFALRLGVGELAENLLGGRRVVPAKLRELGFQWKLPTLATALAAAQRG